MRNFYMKANTGIQDFRWHASLKKIFFLFLLMVICGQFSFARSVFHTNYQGQNAIVFYPVELNREVLQNPEKAVSIPDYQQFAPVFYADEGVDNPDVIYLNATHINVNLPEHQLAKYAGEQQFDGKKMFLIKFSGAIQNEWYRMMTASGAQVIDYIPSYSYLIYADQNAAEQIKEHSLDRKSGIQWFGEYLPAHRISQEIHKVIQQGKVSQHQQTAYLLSIQLFNDPEANSKTMDLLERNKIPGTTIQIQKVAHYINIVVSLDLQQLQNIAQQNDVISIQPYITPTKSDESQNIIMTGNLNGNIPNQANYLTYLADHGFTQEQFETSGFVVNVADDGLDAGSIGNVLNPSRHFGLFKMGDTSQNSRVAFVHKAGNATDADTRGCAGHGNLNAHIIGGYIPDDLLSNSNHTDANGFRYGLGVAPFVKLGSSVLFNSNGNWTNGNFTSIESNSYQKGGRISSNSWGAPVGGRYNSDSQAYDYLVRDAQPTGSGFPQSGNQEMVIVFSAGNSGSSSQTIGSPGTAKNVISVGASEGVRAFGGSDGCGVPDSGANSANDIASFSSRGPCIDGRTKPDIVAPGTHITGGVFPSSVSNPIAGAGTADPCFDGNGVCGGTGGSNFWPLSQQWYTASSGTSHSAPAVAGFSALIRQHFINKGWNPPSPAMTKALIMNSAGYMNGVGANDNLFSNNQGMGMVNMNNYFSNIDNPNIIRDQLASDMFTASGQEFNGSYFIVDTSKPTRITLVYSDKPGSTTGNAYVNNLDLEVIANGTVYKGNVFSGAFSISGGTADEKNNAESVFLPPGFSGNIQVKVKAINIAGDGVPNNGTPLDQDFALIINNVTEVEIPCSGVPEAGEVDVTPYQGEPGSSYTISSIGGATTGSGLTYQWQSKTNDGEWVNEGELTNSLSNFNATAPDNIGDIVEWKIIVTCLDSGESVESTTATFTVVDSCTWTVHVWDDYWGDEVEWELRDSFGGVLLFNSDYGNGYDETISISHVGPVIFWISNVGTFNDNKPNFTVSNGVEIVVSGELLTPTSFMSDPLLCDSEPTSCPDLSEAPENVSFEDSVCQEGCEVSGGMIYAPSSEAPADAHIEYSTDGGTTWSTELPVYNQTESMSI
ncbi:MAG: S8 family serine peptidase, partial [Weeksellaceae bacterium]